MKRMSRLHKSFVVLSLALLPSAAFAQLYVSPGGTGTPPCINAMTPCPLIADALSTAVAGDTIILGQGVYLEQGLTILIGLTIKGAGLGLSIIDALAPDRHFVITAPSGSIVTIKDVTLGNGYVGTANLTYTAGGGAVLVSGGALELVQSEITQSEGYQGGAISCYVGCDGLTVRDSRLADNEAVLGGGAIYTQAPTLVETSGLLRNKSSSGNGGAIYNYMTDLEVRGSRVTHNKAADAGGGIASQFGSTKILRSALIGNDTHSWGGGVYVYGDAAVAAGRLLMLNSTFSGNTGSNGGAIYQDGAGDAWLGNVTMVDNVATDVGGADDIAANGTTFTLSNSILTHPVGSTNPECGGALALAGSDNLIDTASCGIAVTFWRGPINSGALGPLDFHGGPTQSYSIIPGSVGTGDPIDAVVGGCFNPRSGAALTQDQNLHPRPVGAAVLCDIGSFEF
jgi:hypothetical protein